MSEKEPITRKDFYAIIKDIFGNGVIEEKRQAARQQLVALLQEDKEARRFFVTQVSNLHFNMACEELNLPPEFVEKRRQIETEIVRNPSSYKLSVVQESFCDLFFKNDSKNVFLMIQTIKERAEIVPEYRQTYEKYRRLFELAEKITSLDESQREELDVLMTEFVQTAKELGLDSGEKVNAVFDELYQQGKQDFKDELNEQLKNTQDLYEGIEPETIETADGRKVQFYKIQNQTEHQRNFTIMGRSTSIRESMKREGAIDAYLEAASDNEYWSYSVINQSRRGKFYCEKFSNHVTFGYLTPPSGDVISLILQDGQTNGYKISNKKFIVRNNILPLNEFIKQTRGNYNEVVITHPEELKPDMIICKGPEPSEDEIQIAAAFGIPLVYIDKSCYPELANEETNEVISPSKIAADNPLMYEEKDALVLVNSSQSEIER